MELPECLLHGSPFARNVFFKVDEEAKKYSNVVALIDWTRNLFIQPKLFIYINIFRSTQWMHWRGFGQMHLLEFGQKAKRRIISASIASILPLSTAKVLYIILDIFKYKKN
jgi:hypothetical protein